MLVVGTFVITFLVVAAIGYFFLLQEDGSPPEPSTFGSPGQPRASQVADPELRDKMVHTINWLRRILGEGPLPANLRPLTDRPAPGVGVKLLLAVVLLVVSIGTVLGLTALMLQLAKWTLFPVIDALVPVFWSIFVREGGATFLAVVVFVLGVRLSRLVRRPSRFRAGAGLIALALLTFWPLQRGAAMIEARFWEVNAIAHGLAFFASLTLMAAGLETMRRAFNTQEQDSWEI